MTRNEIEQLRAGCSMLEIKSRLGNVHDLPLATRCRIAKEHRFYCLCKNIAMVMFIIVLFLITGGIDQW